MSPEWKVDEDSRYILDIPGNAVYIIHDLCRRSCDPLTNKYGAYRCPVNNDEDDGYLDNNCNIICGSAAFNACGLPKSATFNTVEEASAICEEDYKRRA